MPRPQFSLKTMLWLMACVACFCAGIAFDRGLRHRNRGTRAGGAITKPIYGPPVKALTPPAKERKKPSPFKMTDFARLPWRAGRVSVPVSQRHENALKRHAVCEGEIIGSHRIIAKLADESADAESGES